MNAAATINFPQGVAGMQKEAGQHGGVSNDAAVTACGRRVCAWCKPQRDIGPAPELGAGKVTHGICPECKVVHFAIPESVEVKQHPHGGFTHAPTTSGTARIYRGWWPTRGEAVAAL